MALSANTVFEVRTTGSDTNGGGFVAGASGNDYSLQDSANSGSTDKSTADAACTGATTTVTSATANFGTTIIGNIIYLAGGTGSLTAGWYQVVTRVNSTTITVDRNIAAGTGITMNIGGALLSPAIAGNIAIIGNTIFVKNGTYTINSNTPSITQGAISFAATTVLMVGYSSTRSFGNTDTKPVFQTSGSTITQVQSGGIFYNIIFDGNSQTSSRLTSSASTYIYCQIINFNTITGASGNYSACLFTGNSVGCTGSYFIYCEAYANTATPFTGPCFKCIAYSNTGASTDGFAPAAGNIVCECHSIANGRAGFRGSGSSAIVINCHAQSNTGFGYQAATAGQIKALNCTGYNNSGGLIDTSVVVYQFNVTTIGGDVYTNSGSNDYSLNNTASLGAALRAAGRMAALQTYPRGLTTSYFDIGGVQHADPASMIFSRLWVGM